MLHTFHIPVMGTGFTIDTAIRVAHYGISSVMALADDLLIEKIRKFYSEKFHLPYEPISEREPDGRARRITAYLNMVGQIVRTKLDRMKQEPFFADNDKRSYFEMLPSSSPLRTDYDRLMEMAPGKERDAFAEELTGRMESGSIDVNIMVKVDRTRYSPEGHMLAEEFSDAKAGLRGFATSNLETSSIVFSAGINKGLFRYITQFRDFYRNAQGKTRKKIILKVSDFRSAILQGKFLAQMGLEVFEYRIESGLNCGGHAFGANGRLLSSILMEFKEKKNSFSADFQPIISAYYAKKGWEYVVPEGHIRPRITVQGGIGTPGEARRLEEAFGVDGTGWGTPFLLVPEAVCVDPELMEMLRKADPADLYLSGISPMGVPFNLVRNTSSEKWTKKQFNSGRPGSICPKEYLISNTEFTEKPVCLASRCYQTRKLEQIQAGTGSEEEKARLSAAVLEKTCLCDHLGNSALMTLGIAKLGSLPTVVCPGPNLAWFNRLYSLKEMVNHIYGRGESLALPERPHMLVSEFMMTIDQLEQQVSMFDGSPAEFKRIEEYKENLVKDVALCEKIAAGTPYPEENLQSILPGIGAQMQRLSHLWAKAVKKQKVHHLDTLNDFPSHCRDSEGAIDAAVPDPQRKPAACA